MHKLDRIQRQIDQLRKRAANVRHRELKSIAESLGRRRDTSRGKEPTFVNVEKKWKPLSIPDHPRMAKPTVHSVLDQLEDDLMSLREEGQKEYENGI
jgi:hypothetical protein